MDRLRFPYADIQKAIYDRIKAVNPARNAYAVVPPTDPTSPDAPLPLPYVVLGEFRGIPNQIEKTEKTWNCTYTLNFWSESSQTVEMATMINEVVGGLSEPSLVVANDWNIYDFSIGSGEVYEVMIEEFGPLLHGVILLQMGVEDVS